MLFCLMAIRWNGYNPVDDVQQNGLSSVRRHRRRISAESLPKKGVFFLALISYPVFDQSACLMMRF
jgi:hypothetical protein